MQELAIDVRQYGEPEGIAENIEYSLSLGLPELQMAPAVHDGTMVICGSGPSLGDHLDEIIDHKIQGRPICGIKGAYDYLADRSITPNLYCSVEPRYRPVKNPQKESVFLLSSRVNKQVFDDLKDHAILLWHSWSGDDKYDLPDKMMIGGGTTSGLRMVNVAYILGYRKIVLYGFDSCLGLRGEKRIDQEPLGAEVETTDVIVGREVDDEGNVTRMGKRYVCNMAMAAQAQDFQFLYNIMPDIHIECAGDGLIAAIIEERKRQGKHT